MGEQLIKPYEISVWEDKLTQNGFIENKLAVIGSNTMTGLNKIYNPVFNKKANGEKTLTFSLKYKYFDPYEEKDITNPFVNLLTNESKVKLHYDNKWYEFIVKDHVESSEEYTWEYTCTDAFVLELSKRGYNITFDSELNNNQGTARELVKETLKDTDWKIGSINVGRQLVKEPLYQAVVNNSFQALNTDTGEMEECIGRIYVFYSYIKNKDGKFLQFIKHDDIDNIDDDNVITATNYRILLDDIVVTDSQITYNNTILINILGIEPLYSGNRLVYNQLTTYDSVMERTVNRFKAGDREIYKYTDYIYTTSNVIINYITNGENFNVLEDGTLQGWNPYVDFTSEDPDEKVDKLELITKPELGTGKTLADLTSLSEIEGFLKVKFKGALTNYKNAVFNSGIENNASSIESISKGQKFVFRWRAGQRDPNEADQTKSDVDCLVPCENLRLLVAKYTQDTPNRWSYYYKHIDPENIIMQFSGTPQILNNVIRGGTLEEGEEAGKYNYVIDTIVQTPSTKYVYINGNDNQEYVWNGLQGNFELKTADNYLPYYYLVAEAQKSIPNSSLKDVTENFGIFIYNIEGQVTYYIQDIQLTRFVPDGADATGQTPILLGNIPTATSNQTDYYYLKPADDAVAEDIEMYTSIEELTAEYGISETVVPLYNEGSEKNLSISASKSNCFDILQTIAETFECWIDLVVEHDPDTGYILYDENGKFEKYVYLKEYAGKNNWVGFKYGINLNSIERTVNSDEIVTKLIVDQSQSDLVDEGFVSISSAPSNISGESYILNFEYYYNQNLLDRNTVETDRLAFSTAMADINKRIKEKEKEKNNFESSLVALGSKRNIYTELIETAKETKTDALGEFENLTGRRYEEHKAAQEEAIRYDNNFYVLTSDIEIVADKTYYIYNIETETMIEVETPDIAELDTYYELLDDLAEEDTIFSIIGDLYVSSATINNYSGILTNIEQEYQEVRKKLHGSENYNVKVWVDNDNNLQRHICVELNDYLPGFTFIIDGSSYSSTVSKKYFDIESDSTLITFNAPSGYSIDVVQYNINDSKVAKFKITCNKTIPGIEDEIDDLREEKEALLKDFNNKYSRFIQEGTWNSTDYIDSELYYLDALQVSNTSAQPTVSYTINVVEISQLEGFEWYLFDAGDKSYIEDTEFFGWKNIDNVLTPVKEEVFVTEVEWHLEEPNENIITIQNYKTRFEDFFQRISATVQTVQYNEVSYTKINSLLNADGTINQDALLNSLNALSNRQYNLTSNGSVVINDDVVLIQNLTNPANRVIINSEGIRVSSDGGNSWTTAIDGQGINIGAVYTGTLNTNEVIIGSGDNPSFRWDKSGISAYKVESDGIYDLQTYVRYDQYGLYGVKEGGSFKAQNLQEVLDKAHFAVTWDGFFIKNSYEDGGRVSITSNNDFQVIDGTDTERIKIGSLGIDQNTGNRIYGINISDSNGNSVLNTNNNGDITITGTINANAGVFDGLVRVGANSPYIAIDGENAIIKSSLYSQDGASYGWMINADGDAIFNNITARGAIKTAVFEYAEIQAVGGVFIFRPSSTIRSATVSGNDLIVTVEKPALFKVGCWCKISNYASGSDVGNPDVNNILLNNGLSHVYEVTSVTNNRITLADGKDIITGTYACVDSADELIGGALIDMGRKSGTVGYDGGIHNYGIGVNSSDNTVNLPARSISLFETLVDDTHSVKVSYDYKGIFGTLPTLSSNKISSYYTNYMTGTQGIFTDNMYIGDASKYIAFYTDTSDNNAKKLRVMGADIVFAYSDGQGGTTEKTLDDRIEEIETTPGPEGPEGPEGPAGKDSIRLEIVSSAGDIFLNGSVSTQLTCYIKQGTTDITNQFNSFTWSITPSATGWPKVTNVPYVNVTSSDITNKAIINCTVTI